MNDEKKDFIDNELTALNIDPNVFRGERTGDQKSA